MIVTTSETIADKKIVKTLGLVRGNTIRARHLGKDILAVFRNLVGGEVTEYTKLMGESREQAIDRMIQNAEEQGANHGRSRRDRRLRDGGRGGVRGLETLFVTGSFAIGGRFAARGAKPALARARGDPLLAAARTGVHVEAQLRRAAGKHPVDVLIDRRPNVVAVGFHKALPVVVFEEDVSNRDPAVDRFHAESRAD